MLSSHDHDQQEQEEPPHHHKHDDDDQQQQEEDDDDDPSFFSSSILLLLLAALACTNNQPIFFLGPEDDGEDATTRRQTIIRSRRPVFTIFRELGPTYTRRAYRMSPDTFYNLHRVLLPYLRYNINPLQGSTKTNRNGARNGLVPSTTRLAAALRYFAGGSVYDLAIMHGISCTEVYRSVWRVVDAVNSAESLKIEFPHDHDKQRELALGFRSRSSADFDCCVAAIDGLLIWTERPTKQDCQLARCGAKKFFCGRKHKFGLNLMGTVDYNGRFVDVQIQHPASTSDFLAFATSDLKAKVEQPGFLAPNLVIFGDNAYTNSTYMVTPYKGSRVGTTQDNFNFYHSQLRIQVECSFGKLVHRWGILRRPMSKSIGIKKTSTLVMALCRLHNFCTDENSPNTELPLAVDTEFAVMHAGVELNVTANNALEPTDLLHGGEHSDDVPRNIRRQQQRLQERVVLPQEVMHDHVTNKGLQRPTPRGW